MKIVDLNQFLSMPPGTLYAKYSPCVVEGMAIKGETIWETKDFYTTDLSMPIDCINCSDFEDKLFDSELNGTSIKIGIAREDESRDGCYDRDQLFMVWERYDVYALIGRLVQAVGDSEPERQVTT